MVHASWGEVGVGIQTNWEAWQGTLPWTYTWERQGMNHFPNDAKEKAFWLNWEVCYFLEWKIKVNLLKKWYP